MARKVIIDTDPGIDDTLALLLALFTPDVQVVAVTTVFGNVSCAAATRNALRVLEVAHHAHVPVYAGAADPMQDEHRPFPLFVHGHDGMGNSNQPPPAGAAQDADAASFIIEEAHRSPGEISIIALGPLTNLARALQREPRVAEWVREVVVMGGAVDVNGNVSPAAEANILSDVHAADLVLTAPWKCSLVGLDVSMQTHLTRAQLEELAQQAPVLGGFLSEVCEHYITFHHRRYGREYMHLHDPTAVAFFIWRDVCTVRSGPVRVVCDGIAKGKTLQCTRSDWMSANAWSDAPAVDVCIAVDAEEVRRRVVEAVLRGEVYIREHR